MAQLGQAAQAIGKVLGLTLREATAGGGSDGNLTAYEGITTLDGLGPQGDGLHAGRDRIRVHDCPGGQVDHGRVGHAEIEGVFVVDGADDADRSCFVQRKTNQGRQDQRAVQRAHVSLLQCGVSGGS